MEPDLTQTLDMDLGTLKRKPSTPHAEVWGTLVFLSPPYNRTELTKDQIWFGRHDDCDVKIADNHISGKHLLLMRQRRNRGSKHTDSDGATKQVWIIDHSSNGTYLNGRKLEKGVMVELSHRDEVSLVVPSSHDAVKSAEFKNCFTAFLFELARSGTSTEHTLMRSLTMDLGKKPTTSNGSSSAGASLSPTNSTGLMPPPAARPKAPRARYYSVDEQALLKYGAKPRAVPASPGAAAPSGVTLLRLSRPHVADSHYAAEQFKMAELAFRRFVNRDRMFSVREVDVIVNHKVEQAFAAAENQLGSRPPIDLRAQYNDPAHQQERRVMVTLAESIWWSTETEDRTHGSNPVLAWHGTTEQNIASIATTGFEVRATKDSGWYGRGIYFTQLPNYGEFYINNCLSEMGDQFSLILSWVLLGKPYPVVRKLDGQGCMPGYDSHVCLVNGFLPCGPDEEPTGDEIVVFRSDQVLPRYVVHYEIKKKAKFVPIALLDSSDEDEQDELPAPPTSAKVACSPTPTPSPALPSPLPSPLGGSTTAVDRDETHASKRRAFSLLTSSGSVSVPDSPLGSKTPGSTSSTVVPSPPVLSAALHLHSATPSPQLNRSTTNVTATGETTVCAVRAKLFSLLPEGGWYDVGVGTARVIVDQSKSARLVQHLETTGNVVLNAQLLAGMVCERPNEKALRIAVIDPVHGPQAKLLRLANPDDCTTLYNSITAHTCPKGVEDTPLRRVLSLSHSSSAVPPAKPADERPAESGSIV